MLTKTFNTVGVRIETFIPLGKGLKNMRRRGGTKLPLTDGWREVFSQVRTL